MNPARSWARWAQRLTQRREWLMEAAERHLGAHLAPWMLRGCELGTNVSTRGRVRLLRRGTVRIGDDVTFLGGMIPTELVCGEAGLLEIGAGCFFNYGASIRASREVRIGKRCMFASMTQLWDVDGGAAAPIVIEDDVWVAHGARIAPGVRVGAESVISAGAVVLADVGPRSVAIGNPARLFPLEMIARAS